MYERNTEINLLINQNSNSNHNVEKQTQITKFLEM